MYSIKAAAGHGAAVLDELPSGNMKLERSFLRSAGVAPKDVILLDAKGDSMFPTIPDGAHMLINRRDRSWTDGCIYVVRIDGDIVVKRVRRSEAELIELISDNSTYGVRRLDGADLENAEALGRVFFVMQQL